MFSHFTYVVAVPGYMLWLKRIYLGWVAFCRFVVLYLCFGGTWVHVVTKKDLLRLIYVYGDCCLLPVVWLYLGTCYDRKEST